MRTVETSMGPVEVRALTRQEIRAGKAMGLRYFGPGELKETFEDARDHCLTCLLGERLMDEHSNADCNRLFMALIAETWGDPGEEKNSPSSGPSDRTETE